MSHDQVVDVPLPTLQGRQRHIDNGPGVTERPVPCDRIRDREEPGT
jgi:hypothetical protein